MMPGPDLGRSSPSWPGGVCSRGPVQILFAWYLCPGYAPHAVAAPGPSILLPSRFVPDPSPTAGTPRTDTATSDPYHVPVLLAEVLSALAPEPGKLIVDGTLGGGGHTKAILAMGAKIIGLDRDGGAIGYCIQHLVVYDGDTVRLKQADYRDLGHVLQAFHIDKVDGILLDLGVSSTQLDRAERGFSFQQEGPLDMRMNPAEGSSAADLVNEASEEELTGIFQKFGEEPAARRIAAAIGQARKIDRITTTLGLAAVVERVVPRHGPRHPATRVFQALRMVVNDELGALRQGLEASIEFLRPGGRLAVITFHSLEDRIVKSFCRETSAPTIDRPEWPAPRPNPRLKFRAITRRAISASEEEQRRNPRARSAKLRALERLSL